MVVISFKPGSSGFSRQVWLLSLVCLSCLTTATVFGQQPSVATGLSAERGAAAVLIYVDDNETQVIKTTTSGSASHGSLTTNATIGFDFITAASVDLITAASPRGFTERRTQVNVGLSQNLGEGTRYGGSYNLSHEPDYLTHSFTLNGQREFLGRHLIFTHKVGLSLSTVGRRNDSAFSRSRQGVNIDLGLTRIVTRTLAIDLNFGLAIVRGFQASAYRYVRLYAEGSSPTTADLTGLHRTAITEKTPDQRLRNTWVGRLRWRASSHVFLHAGYRFYLDDWAMTGHTLTGRALWTPGGGPWSLTLRGRFHSQSAVSFYRRRYTSFPLVPALRTADKELGALWTGLVGTHVEWSPAVRWAEGLHVGLGADWLHIRYLDYAFLDQRNALLVTLDVTLKL